MSTVTPTVPSSVPQTQAWIAHLPSTFAQSPSRLSDPAQSNILIAHSCFVSLSDPEQSNTLVAHSCFVSLLQSECGKCTFMWGPERLLNQGVATSPIWMTLLVLPHWSLSIGRLCEWRQWPPTMNLYMYLHEVWSVSYDPAEVCLLMWGEIYVTCPAEGEGWPCTWSHSCDSPL